MSKGQKGNKEAKKPKKEQARPVMPSAVMPTPPAALPDRLKKR